MTHAGHSHDTKEQLGIEAVARQEAAVMGAAREELEKAGFEVPWSRPARPSPPHISSSGRHHGDPPGHLHL